jgi:hypothetical protein
MALPKFNHPWVDETHAPILVCEGPANPGLEEMLAYLAKLETFTKSVHEPYCWVVRPAQLGASQRKAMAESQKQQEPYLKKHAVALAFVISNPVIRGVLSEAFDWASRAFAATQMPVGAMMAKPQPQNHVR